MPDELRRSIGAVFIKGFQIAEPAVLVNECVLIEFLSFRFSDKTRSRNKFDIDLPSLSRILHLFVRFRPLFRIGEFDGLAVDAAQNPVQTGDGSGVSALAQLDPKHYQTGMRVPTSHIFDEFDFCIRMLIGVAVRAVGAVCQGTDRAVIFLTPAVDILSAGLVADGCFSYTIFEGIFNYHLLKPHVLCYLTHSE